MLETKLVQVAIIGIHQIVVAMVHQIVVIVVIHIVLSPRRGHWSGAKRRRAVRRYSGERWVQSGRRIHAVLLTEGIQTHFRLQELQRLQCVVECGNSHMV